MCDLRRGAPHQLRLGLSAKVSYPLPTGEGETKGLVVSLQRFVILYHAKTLRHEEDYKAQPLFSAAVSFAESGFRKSIALCLFPLCLCVFA